MLLTPKIVNAELAKRGHNSRLEHGDGYFYFSGGEAAAWLHRTVVVPNVNSLTLDQWIGEFERLKKLKAEIMKPPGKGASAITRPAKKSAR